MIAIPNIEKPKDCKECQWHLDFYIEDKQVGGLCTITEKDDKENTCPLIEIEDEAIDIAQDIMDGCKELKERVNKDLVRCGECKHRDSEFCQIRESMYGIKDNDFCSYGERRADE